MYRNLSCVLAALFLIAFPEPLSAQKQDEPGFQESEEPRPQVGRDRFKPKPAPTASDSDGRDKTRNRRVRRNDDSVSLWRILLYTALIVGGLTVLYHLLPARRLPAKSPGLSIFPKYSFELRLPESVHAAAEPVPELARRLAEHGFSKTSESRARVVFSRGSVWRQSIENGLLQLTFRLPLMSSSSVEARAGWIIAFDTGDLWAFCSSLQEGFAEADRSQPT